MNDVFISYSSKDSKEAMEVCQLLEFFKISCWIAERDLKAGKDYPEAITNAIRDSQTFLVLISRNSLASEQVKKELTIANNMEKYGMKIAVVMLDSTLDPENLNASFDYILAGIQACWWQDKPRRSEIVTHLAEILGREIKQTDERRLNKLRVEELYFEGYDDSDDYEEEEVWDDKRYTAIGEIGQMIAEIPKQFEKIPKIPIRRTLFSGKPMVVTGKSSRKYIFGICIIVAVLTFLGVVMLYSASSAISGERYYDEWYYVRRHALMIVCGFSCLYFCSQMSLQWLKGMSVVLGILAFLVLFLLVTPLGATINGVKRWLVIGSISVKVDEFAVLGAIFFFAFATAFYRKNDGKIQYMIMVWGYALVLALLVFVIPFQPFTACMIGVIMFAVTLVFADLVWFHKLAAVLTATLVAIPVLANLLANGTNDYRTARIRAWLAPTEYENSWGYHIIKNLEAAKNGGIFGKGIGNGSLVTNYPLTWQDGIFALICEEMGWLVAAFVVILLIGLYYQVYKIMRMAIVARLYFGAALTLGILVHLGFRSFCYVAMNLNLLPIASGFIPFLTYAGNLTIQCFCELGCVFAVARESQKRLNARKNQAKRIFI